MVPDIPIPFIKKQGFSRNTDRSLLMSNGPGHGQKSPTATEDKKMVFVFQPLEWRLAGERRF